MKKLFFLLSFLLLSFSVSFAQTRAYKYLYSVKDEVKIKNGCYSKGEIHYFTFTNNKHMCYLTDKDGVYRSEAGGLNSYRFVGEKDGVLIYKEVGQLMGGERATVYFSSDYNRLNMLHWMDNYCPGAAGSIQVWEYVADPNSVDVPSQLY